jgi:hypothetical protein
MNLGEFTPDGNNNTVNVAASTTAAHVAFPANIEVQAVEIYNKSDVEAYVEFGDINVVASVTTSPPIGPRACVVVGANRAKYASAVLASGTGTVYFTPGRGV